jgi:DNA-binding GntR family transcriptional regulator
MPKESPAVPSSSPLASNTAVEQVVRHIRNGVRLGRYAPGQRLTEVDMTRELQVSRGPLREAMARLAAEGVVEIEPYRGAMVRRLTEADLRELYDAREALEGQAAALAARRVAAGVDPRVLKDESRRQAAMKATDMGTYMDENIAFHDAVVQLSGNRLLASLMEQLHTNTFRIQVVNLIPLASRDASMREHANITRAILAGRDEEAERAMRHHVRESCRLVVAAAAPLYS